MNLLDVLKKQIAEQTKSHLNTDLHKSRPQGVTRSDQQSIVGGVSDFIPKWTYGSYNLQRSNGLTVSDFINYSGVITWKIIESQKITLDDLTTGSNHFLGVQLFANRDLSLPLEIVTTTGFLRVYTKNEGETSFNEITAINTDVATTINVPLKAFTWTTIAITFYGYYFGSRLHVGSTYPNVVSWRFIDITSPNIPTWADPPLEVVLANPQNARDAIRLRWKKDKELSFAGNIIYRKSKLLSGGQIESSAPSRVVSLLSHHENDHQKWFRCNTIGSLNSGDIISAASTLTAATFKVSQIINIEANKIKNSVFANGTKYFIIDKAANVNYSRINYNPYIGDYYLHFDGYITSALSPDGKISITSTYINVAPQTYYSANIFSKADLLSKRPYNLGGYGSTPSRWQVKNLTSAIATRRNGLQAVQLIRSSAAGSISTKYTTANHVMYLQAYNVATYQISCRASSSKLTAFSISIKNEGSTVLLTTPTLYAGPGYLYNNYKFSISSAAYARLVVNIHAKSGIYTSSTIDLSLIDVSYVTRNLSRMREGLRLYYYQSNKTPCSPSGTFLPIGFSQGVRADGSAISTGWLKLPSTCAYLKMSYIASIISGTAPLGYVHNDIFGFSLVENREQSVISVYSTPYSLVRTISNAPSTPGSLIYFEQFQPVHDRPRQSSDGEIITWDDYSIEDNTVYEYLLQAYDNSVFKNTSGFSVSASIRSGDHVAPKPPSSYTLTPAFGGFIHDWVAPTASDLRYIRCYSDVGLTNTLFQIPGIINSPQSYTESNTVFATQTRYLTAIDAYGNESSAVNASAKPLDLPKLTCNVAIIQDLGGGDIERLEPTPGRWYSGTVTASLILSRYSPIASYMYSLYQDEKHYYSSTDWSSWTEFNGQYTITDSFANNLRHRLRFKIKDIYGNWSDVKEITIFYDSMQPAWKTNKRHQYWDKTTQGYDGYILLKWNKQYVTDKNVGIVGVGINSIFDRSGLKETFISRATLNITNKNPNFDYGKLNETPVGWRLRAGSLGYDMTASLYLDDFYSPNQCVKLRTKSIAGAYQGYLASSTIRLNANATIYTHIRVKNSSSVDQTYKLQIVDKNKTALAYTTYSNQTTTTYWKYHALSYKNITGAMITVQVELAKLSGGGNIVGDYLLVDEFVAYKEPQFKQIAAVASRHTSFTDTKVSPWSDYLYYTQISDEVGNLSTISDYKHARPAIDYRSKFRNMLNNSSFEKVRKTATNRLEPENWVPWIWSGPFATTSISPTSSLSVRMGDSFHGQHCVQLKRTNTSVYDRWVQNDINILAYNGTPRKFVISGYFRRYPGASSGAGFLGVQQYSKDHTLVSSKTFSISVATDSWTRVSGTFSVAAASVSNLSVYVRAQSVVSLPLLADAIQLEEKETLPASEYYDNYAITADYIQGNLIRANMIEADSIYGNHIRAGTITATNIKANTITATQFRMLSNNIYLKGGVEIPINSTLTPTIHQYRFIPGTMVYSSRFLFRYINIGLQTAAGTTKVYTGYTSKTCDIDYTSHNIIATFDRYTNAYPGIAMKYPHASDGYAVALLQKKISDRVYSLATMYTSYVSLSNSTQRNNLRGWSTLQAVATMMYTPLSKLLYTNSPGDGDMMFLVGTRFINMGGGLWGDYGIKICRLSEKGEKGGPAGGEWQVSKQVAAAGQNTIVSLDADVSPAGTIMVAYCRGTATLYTVGYSYDNGNVVIPTMQIRTYSGYTNSFTGGPLLCWTTSIAYCSDNQFLVVYSFYNDFFTYYKVIDIKTQQVIVGGDRDLLLSSPSKHGINESSDSNVDHARLTNTGYGDIFYYYPTLKTGTLAKDRGIGGYIEKIQVPIDLSDLFSRIA